MLIQTWLKLYIDPWFRSLLVSDEHPHCFTHDALNCNYTKRNHLLRWVMWIRWSAGHQHSTACSVVKCFVWALEWGSSCMRDWRARMGVVRSAALQKAFRSRRDSVPRGALDPGRVHVQPTSLAPYCPERYRGRLKRTREPSQMTRMHLMNGYVLI